MSLRPLVFVSGLTFCDYLLWNWSLNQNHDVLALVSGLTLPPLAVAWVWLMVLFIARLLARFARGSAAGVARGRARERAQSDGRGRTGGAPLETAAGANADAPSRKLAA